VTFRAPAWQASPSRPFCAALPDVVDTREPLPPARSALHAFRWRRKRPAPPREAPRPKPDSGPIVIIQNGDFVRCQYKGCGILQPIVDAAQRLPCAGCGRL
jgi:hypothetical protein